MYSLDPDIFRSEERIESLTGLHLVLLNFDIFQDVFPEDDMNQFCRIFVDLSANKQYR